jgi:hypothetical protein
MPEQTQVILITTILIMMSIIYLLILYIRTSRIHQKNSKQIDYLDGIINKVFEVSNLLELELLYFSHIHGIDPSNYSNQIIKNKISFILGAYKARKYDMELLEKIK